MIHKAIDEILQREGPYSDHPNDSGGRTAWGISERWHPEAWKNGPPSRDEAISIYYHRYIIRPGFVQIKNEKLRDFVVDWGVVSGPTLVTQKLQRVLQVEPDGVFGPLTLRALEKANPDRVLSQMIDERVRSAARLVQSRPKDLVFLLGWINRALSFRDY